MPVLWTNTGSKLQAKQLAVCSALHILCTYAVSLGMGSESYSGMDPITINVMPIKFVGYHVSLNNE
jgi:hypothetical protein